MKVERLGAAGTDLLEPMGQAGGAEKHVARLSLDHGVADGEAQPTLAQHEELVIGMGVRADGGSVDFGRI